jgi:hypothetical protein
MRNQDSIVPLCPDKVEPPANPLGEQSFRHGNAGAKHREAKIMNPHPQGRAEEDL